MINKSDIMSDLFIMIVSDFKKEKRMNQLMALFDDFKNLPKKYNREEYINAAEKAILFQKSVTAETAVFVGNILKEIKEHEGHGNWYKALESLDLDPKKAERLIKIADKFGDDPSKLSGISPTKAYLLTTIPEENLIQLKQDELFISSDGTAYTLGEIREMSGKEFENKLLNLRNQKNKDLSRITIERDNYKAEIEDTRVEYEKVMKQLEELPKGKNETLYKEKKALEQYVEDLTKKLNSLEIKMKEMEEQKYNEQEIIEAMSNASKALFDAHIKINNVKIEFDNRKLRAKILAFFQESRQVLNFTTQNYEHKIDESIDNDSTHQSTG